MQAYDLPDLDRHVTHPRLAEIAADLAISDAQEEAWNVFVGTFNAIDRTIAAIDGHASRRFADHAPTLPELLEAQADALSTRVKAICMLKAITESLYCALTPGQRESANRLLPGVCSDLVMPRTLH